MKTAGQHVAEAVAKVDLEDLFGDSLTLSLNHLARKEASILIRAHLKKMVQAEIKKVLAELTASTWK